MAEEFYRIVYKLMVSIFSVIDFLKEVVDILSGKTGSTEDMLLSFLTTKAVTNAFFIILLIGFALLFVFTLAAVIKNESDAEKKSTGEILGRSFKSFLSFLVIPFLLVSGILLTSVIMQAVNVGMRSEMPGQNSIIGGELLVTVARNAYTYDPGSLEGIERLILTGEINYLRVEEIVGYYDIREINYFVGIVGGTVMLVMLFIAAVVFVQRMFDIILLYIISPIPVSAMPLDNGTRFSTWRELIIGKTVSAYGIVLSLNLFFLIVPAVSSMVKFDDYVLDGMLKLLFMIGGTFAVTKANVLIAQLAGKSAGRSEMYDVISNMRTAKSFGSAGTAAMLTGIGTILGGKQFLNLKKTSGSVAAITKVFSTKGTPLSVKGKGSKAFVSGTGGIIRDLVSGGVVRTVKDVRTGIKTRKGGNW